MLAPPPVLHYDPESIRMEIPNQPGTILRAARERAGWTVADVVHRTKFPRSVVEALEHDDYTVFSSPTYARSYLSQYAAFLEVDAACWLDFFEPAAFAAPHDVLSMIESPIDQGPHHGQSGPRHGGSGGMLPALLLLLLTGGLIYGAVTGYTYLEKRFGETIANRTPAPPQPPVQPTSSEGPSQPAASPTGNALPSSGQPAATPPPAEAEKAPRATIVIEE